MLPPRSAVRPTVGLAFGVLSALLTSTAAHASGRFTVGLTGGVSASGVGTEYFGVVELAIAGNAAGSAAAGPDDVQPSAKAPPAAPPLRDRLPASPPPRQATSERAFTGAPREPTASRTPASALALARRTLAEARRVLDQRARFARLESMATRSRAAASLPDVRLRAGTSRDESLRLAPTVNDPARFTQSGATDLWFEARLSWSLGRALFHDDEIRIERLRDSARKERSEVGQRVVSTLVEWQKQDQLSRSEYLTDEQRGRARLACLAAEIELDLLTDGWFSQHVAQPAAPATGRPSR